jgi:hypothetical protein
MTAIVALAKQFDDKWPLVGIISPEHDVTMSTFMM